MQKISAKIYVETGFRGCNNGLIVTSQGPILVDTPQFPTDAVKLRGEIGKFGKLLFLINTEHHLDHTIGNYFFEAPVISHRGTLQQFDAAIGGKEAVRQRVGAFDPEGLKLVDDWEPRRPTITFDRGLSLHIGDETIELFHMPGHTPNEIAVHVVGERVLFTGDNLVNNVMPFLHQCAPREWLRTLDLMKGIDVDKIVPGHGSVCGKEAIDVLASYIKEVMETVQKAIDAGWSKEEASSKITFIDRFPIPAYLRERAPAVQKMNIERIYDELSR